MNRIFKLVSLLFILGLFMCACSENYVPKPRGYFRISFPEKSYHPIADKYPFQFDLADYSILRDLAGKDNEQWLTITAPEFKADLHLTYDQLDGNLDKHIEEARKLAYDHSIKADAIDEKMYINPQNKVYGMVYYIDGNAASPMQFFMTDSVDNFMRGAFYIRELPNVDSIQPVIDFFEPDVRRLIETLQWND